MAGRERIIVALVAKVGRASARPTAQLTHTQKLEKK